MVIAIAMVAWAAVLVVVVGACACARRGESSTVDVAEPAPVVVPVQLSPAEEALLGFERAA